MARRSEHMVQRGHHYAIVDEVDSILIDEARTPLIISGPPSDVTKLYYQFASIARSLDPRRRLRGRRGEEDGHAHRGRHREGREPARRDQPLRRRRDQLRAPVGSGAARQGALPPRQGLPGRRRRGEDRRRVHRPHPRGSALERRSAPGRRGQRARAHPGREPHLGDGHAAELLPPLREAGRHDRYRRDRGRRVRQHLRALGRADPDEPPGDPRRPARPHLQDRSRRSSRRSSTTCASATTSASRSCSVPRRSRSPSCSRASSPRPASPTRC